MESGDTLVVTKLDRIGRGFIDVQKTVELFSEQGIRLIVLQLGNLDLTSSSGALMAKVLAAVADFERELIVERTIAGQARARAAGTHMGRPSKTTDKQRQVIRSRLVAGQTVSAVARDSKLSRATVMGIRDASLSRLVGGTTATHFRSRSIPTASCEPDIDCDWLSAGSTSCSGR